MLPFLLLSACVEIIDGVEPHGELIGRPGENPDPGPTEDVIEQVSRLQVDVLWVVDDSCSIEEQEKLAGHGSAFFNALANGSLDWHVGVVSTDVDDASKNGKLQELNGLRYISGRDPGAVLWFQDAVRLGNAGSVQEAGLLAAHRALMQPTPELQRANEDFLRPDAALHVIVVSDEDDDRTPPATREALVTHLTSLRPPHIPVTFSSIVGPSPDGCSSPEIVAEAGTAYLDVTNQVGGVVASLCDEDWTPVMEALGREASALRREFILTDVPVPGTVRVWVEDGAFVRGGVNEADVQPPDATAAHLCDDAGYTLCILFRYDPVRNSVLLVDEDFVPAADSLVHIEYERLRTFEPSLDRE